jgi:hypothetical protein
VLNSSFPSIHIYSILSISRQKHTKERAKDLDRDLATMLLAF